MGTSVTQLDRSRLTGSYLRAVRSGALTTAVDPAAFRASRVLEYGETVRVRCDNPACPAFRLMNREPLQTGDRWQAEDDLKFLNAVVDDIRRGEIEERIER